MVDDTSRKEVVTFDDVKKKTAFWLQVIWRKKFLVIGVSILGAIIGVLIAWMNPVTYTSSTSFILEESKPGNNLSAIAGQFGVDIASGSSGSNILAGDNIIGLMKSRRFTTEVLLTPYDGTYSLADRYAEVYDLRNQWKQSASVGKEIFFSKTLMNTPDRIRDSLLFRVVDKVIDGLAVTRPDKKMSFLMVSTTTKDEFFSKLYVERLVETVVNFYVETKTRRHRSNISRLESRADSIARLLNRNTFAAASAQSKLLDVNPAYQTTTVPAEVITRDKGMLGIIYSEVVKNLEMQKAMLTQETPVIQVVDTPELPLRKNRTSKTKLGLTGLLLSFAIASTLIIFIYGNQRSR